VIRNFRHKGLKRLFEEGERKGFWAVTVRANWRVVFRLDGGHAVDVDLLDYH
jgi:proteic killer suppression protein